MTAQRKKAAKKPLVIESAEAFKVDGGYRFPFDVMDKTPGGGNLGRIEWHVEFIRSRKVKGRIGCKHLHVWATQTRDERYRGKTFVLPCDTLGLLVSRRDEGNCFTQHVWNFGFCPDHGAPVMVAYPENRHTTLVFDNLFTSFGSDIFFSEHRASAVSDRQQRSGK